MHPWLQRTAIDCNHAPVPALPSSVHAICSRPCPDLAAVEDALANWLGDCFDEDEALALLRLNVGNDVRLGAGAGYEVMVLAPITACAIAILSEDIGDLVELVSASSAFAPGC
ncbi:hypothetical protein [Massilia sp. X63]|jgi:hypothetical protein|uniref:hypothetical protein n=1 Tax=Massilia sp. X63 TaxID=3237285 RepID=UPI0034DDA3F6